MTPEDAIALAAIQERSYTRVSAGLRESYPRSRLMDAGRLAAFLDARRYAVLATSRPDGRPQAAPIAFIIMTGAFWFASIRGARLRNLRAHPYAAVVVAEGEGSSHRAVIAEGPVVLRPYPPAASTFEAFVERWRLRHGSPPDWAAALIEMHPERLFSYDASLSEPTASEPTAD